MKGTAAKAFFYLSLPTIFVVALALIFMWWRVPTRVQVDVLVDRATLTIGGEAEEATRILDSIPFQSLMADSIAHAVFSPEKLEVAMPDEHEDELTSPDPLEKISDSTWKPVTVSDFEVNLEAKSAGRGGRLTFEPWISKSQESKAMAPISLGRSPGLSIELKGAQSDPVLLKVTSDTSDTTAKISMNRGESTHIGIFGEMSGSPGSTLTLELSQGPNPGLLLKMSDVTVDKAVEHMIQLYTPFHLIVDNVVMNGVVDLPSPQAQTLTLRSHKLEFDPTVTLGAREELIVNIRPSQTGLVELFSRNSTIPITAISFLQQGPAGKPLTSLVDRGTLRYPEYPQLAAVEFEPPDVLSLEQLDTFVIQRMSLDQQAKGLRIRLHGIANTISTGSQEFQADHRLTRFDVLWNHKQLWVLGGILVWMIGTSVGIYNFMNSVVKERKP